MKKLFINQKGNTVVVILVIAVLVILAFWWLIKSGYKFPGQISQVPGGYQNTSDLDTASKQLDATNINELDPGINQISSDSQSF